MKRSRLLIGLLAACVLAFGLIAAGPLAGLAQEADTPLTTDSGIALETQATKYDLWVAGKQVTSANASNVLGNGTVKYNAKTNTLTLKNAKITNAKVISKTKGNNTSWWNFGIESAMSKKLTINLVGKNKIVMPSKNSPVMNYGISTKGDLVIGGKGSLTVTANKAQVYSAGIMSSKALVVQGKAKVSSKGVATKVTSKFITYLPQYGGYGVVADKVVMKGNARLTAIGAKTGFYKPFNPKFGFAKGYTPHVKAGASAKSIKVNKNKPAKSVYTKYKYVNITKASKASLKPAQMKFTVVQGLPSRIYLEWNTLSKNCTGYDFQLSKGSSFPDGSSTWKSSTNNTQMNSMNIDRLSPSTTYYVRIRGVNKVGAKTYYGTWSATKAVTTLSGGAAG